jgi:hypothetical protein
MSRTNQYLCQIGTRPRAGTSIRTSRAGEGGRGCATHAFRYASVRRSANCLILRMEGAQCSRVWSAPLHDDDQEDSEVPESLRRYCINNLVAVCTVMANP